MPKLTVNVDHLGTLREARKLREPDPVAASVLIELAGAHGISAHLREDRKHLHDRDIKLLRQTLSTKLNLVMAPTQNMIQFAIDVLPDMVTLVMESKESLTIEAGLNVSANMAALEKMVASLRMHDIFVSLLIEPDFSQIKAAKKIGAHGVELFTGAFANAYDYGEDDMSWQIELDKIEKSAQLAKKNELAVYAGVGLSYNNVEPLASLPELDEVDIGHAIVARAALVGLDKAVRDMLGILGK